MFRGTNWFGSIFFGAGVACCSGTILARGVFALIGFLTRGLLFDGFSPGAFIRGILNGYHKGYV